MICRYLCVLFCADYPTQAVADAWVWWSAASVTYCVFVLKKENGLSYQQQTWYTVGLLYGSPSACTHLEVKPSRDCLRFYSSCKTASCWLLKNCEFVSTSTAVTRQTDMQTDRRTDGRTNLSQWGCRWLVTDVYLWDCQSATADGSSCLLRCPLYCTRCHAI